jgi:hypothetical protein
MVQVSDMVLYRCRPGQVRAGQLDLAAMVTKINSDGTLELTVYPALSEPCFQSKVPALSDGFTGHCWHPRSEPEVVLDIGKAQAQARAAAELHRAADARTKKTA